MIPNEISRRNEEQALSDIYVHEKGFKILPQTANSKTIIFVLLFALLASLLFSRLGSPSVYILDEARNAQCAREMMQNHTLLVPTFNGKLRTDKPPLHYYFMITAYKLFGVSSFSARFFSAVFGLLTIILLALFVNRYIGSQAALFSAVVISSSSHFLFEFRQAVPDPYFIFFLTAGLFSGFGWLKNNKSQLLYLAAVLLGLAALAKGPVAIVLPAISFTLFCVYKRNWKTLFSWHLIPALLLFLAVALPWYLLIHEATDGQWTRAFFWDQNIERFSSVKEGHGGFFLLPLLILLVGLMPFSAFAVIPIRKRRIIFDNDAVVFSLIVFAVIVIFFSFSKTQLPNYALPAYPFAAIILGYYLTKVLEQKLELAEYPRYVTVAFFCLVPIISYFLLKSEVQTTHLTWISFLLITPALFFIATLLKRDQLSTTSKIYAIAGVSFMLNVLTFLIAYPIVYKNNPVAKTLSIVKQAPRVISYNHYNAAYNFYLDSPIKRFNANEIDSLKTSARGTIIITTVALLKDLDSLDLKLVAVEHDIFERRETAILSK